PGQRAGRHVDDGGVEMALEPVVVAGRDVFPEIPVFFTHCPGRYSRRYLLVTRFLSDPAGSVGRTADTFPPGKADSARGKCDGISTESLPQLQRHCPSGA